MKKKIKVHINTSDVKLNLPAMPLWMLNMLSGYMIKHIDDDVTKEKIKENKALIKKFFNNLNKALDEYEPFTLVEVERKDAHINIDVL